MRPLATLLGCLAMILNAALAAAADDRKWEVSVHGALAAPTQSAAGVALLGEGSMPIGTVPTWFFGDGGVLLGGISQSLRLGAPATLDGALKRAFIARRAGGGFGVRVSRTMTPRWSLELSLDENFARTRVADASRAALDQAGASFTTAFNALLAIPGRQASTSSTVSIDDGRGRQLVATGALAINLPQRGRLAPYVTVGGGAMIAQDESATARIVGDYRFVLPVPSGLAIPIPAPSIHETDTVTIQSHRDSAFTGLFGAGVRYAAGARWGVRADVRDYVSANRTTTTVAAAPTADRGSTAVFASFGFFNGRTVQMSTAPGIPSTLSGTLTDQPTFRGTGAAHQINASVGVYWRF